MNLFARAKRWVEIRVVSAEVLPYLSEWAPERTDPWYFRTRRGGVYRALPPFDRNVIEDATGLLTVTDRSSGARYLRPGTRERATAEEALR